MKKYSQLTIISKIFKQTFTIAPFSSIIIFIQYLVRGFFPLLLFVFTSRLTNEAVLILNGEGSIQVMTCFTCLLILSFIIMQFLNGVESISLDVGVYEKCRRYRNKLFMNASFNYPLIEFEKSEFLDLQKRAKDTIEQGILSHIFTRSLLVISSVIGVISVSITLSLYSPWYLVAALISVIPYYISRLIRGRAFYKTKKIKASTTRYRDYFFGLFLDKRSVRELRVNDCSEFIYKKYALARDDVNNEILRQSKIELRSILLCEVIKIIGYIMSITITLFLSFYKDLPIGVFAASIAAFTAVQNSTKGLFRGVGELYEYNKYAQDFYAFIEDQSEILSCTIGQLNSIECKNLCFTYPDVKRETLKNINFKLNKGESVAIVGENGSGKTTLVKLLLNLYLPDKGSIIFNGEELLKQQNVILNEASVIQQDIMQYAFSLRANVAISDFSRFENDEKIKGCLEYAGLKRDTNLEEVLSPEFGGKDLSKGQWQRVSIARGLFRNREFLFVDEPTAAIDPMSEYDLLRKLLFLKDQKTMVIVSHRCGICKYTDRIIVMKQGKIAESGTHQELLSVNGEYKRMFTEQAKWYN